MNRREGENGNGFGTFLRRYWQIGLVAGGLIAAGAVGQRAIAENAKDIAALQKKIDAKLDTIQTEALKQAKLNGKIEAYLDTLMKEKSAYMPNIP